MGCSHKKAVQVISCVYPRPKPTIIDDDRIVIHWCPSCGAVRQDAINIYCYSKGRWSNGGAEITIPASSSKEGAL
jgi:hypothetical protein